MVARKAIVSSIDPRRLFKDLVPEDCVPGALKEEIGRIHSGIHNVAELKIDALVDCELPPMAVPGFERGYMVSANTLVDLERAFGRIALGELPSVSLSWWPSHQCSSPDGHPRGALCCGSRRGFPGTRAVGRGTRKHSSGLQEVRGRSWSTSLDASPP